jgi:phytoene/squalene synthetase
MLYQYPLSRTFQIHQTRYPKNLAANITRSNSKQSYYIIRFLVDRIRVPQAYRAYGYFRWVDDCLDMEFGNRSERIAFVKRQRAIMDRCYRGERPTDVTIEENMFVNLIQRDLEKNSGLQSYIRNMMAVMVFDARRRGSLITEEELTNYSHSLATAVTDALHYFIGHDCFSPQIETRHYAATAAHITHMLRDTYEDLESGYFNVPREFLENHRISPWDVPSQTYREWVKRRVDLARAYFAAGREYLSRVEHFRCRIAGYTYIGRFEPVLDAIESEDYHLRPEYPECKSLGAGLKMCLLSLSQSLPHPRGKTSTSVQMVEEKPSSAKVGNHET